MGVLTAGLAAAVTTVAPAGATVVDRMRAVDEPYTLVFDECQGTYGPWLDHYNTQRRHSAIGGLPPISRLS